MPRLIDFFRRSKFPDDPLVTLFHYACGHMADWANGSNGKVIWAARTHRGVQWLNKVEFPRKQKRYIFSPQFEIRYNTAFEETIRACAESGMAKENKTWIIEGYIRGMINLNKLGFAHSFEAWNDGKLVGGSFGVQLGSLMTCDSMFYRMSNASKAAYGQTLVRLQERGFRVVDTNGVAQHQVNYGEEWMPQWKYELLLAECMQDRPTLVEGTTYPALPASIRRLLPVAKFAEKVGRKLGSKRGMIIIPASAPEAAPAAATEPASDPAATAATPSADTPGDSKPNSSASAA